MSFIVDSRCLRTALAVSLLAATSAAQIRSVGPEKQPLPQPHPEPQVGTFVERALDVGLDHVAVAGLDRIADTPMTTWAQAGIAIGDLDGNGLPDIVAAGGIGPNSVFTQQPDGTFLDVSAAAGINAGEYDRSVTLGDIDRDGDLDLFLGALDRGADAAPGRSRMYLNDGNAVFTDITSLTGTVGSGHSIYVKFFDIDLDGWLDLYVGEFLGTPNHVYRNNTNLSFTDVTDEVGLAIAGSTHAVAIGDVDGDGRPDVVVGQDYAVNNLVSLPNNDDDGLFLNDASGVFTDVAVEGHVDTRAGVMGVALVDIDYDGLVDIYKTNTGANFLYMNHGWPHSGLPFTEEAGPFGLLAQTIVDQNDTAPGVDAAVSWAPLFFNADLDPWLDAYVTNGHIPGGNPLVPSTALAQENFFYRGAGLAGGLPFVEMAETKGLFSEVDDRGAAVGDIDLDGDVDLLVMSPGGRLRYYENQLDRNGRGSVRVTIDSTTSAPDGIGASVLRFGEFDERHLRLIGSDGPTASNNALEAFYGMGLEPMTDVTVTFPTGIQLTLDDVPTNTQLAVAEPLLVEVSETILIAEDGVQPTVEVVAHAHDMAGVPLTAHSTCSIECSSATPLSDVEALGSGSFRRQFQLPALAGEVRVAVSFNGFTPLIEPRIHILGDVSSETSLLTVSPEWVRAESSDIITATFTPRDELGRSFPAGKTVALSLGGVAPIGAIVDLGDGRYQAQFAAPTALGPSSFSATVDDVTFPDIGSVTAAGEVSSTITIATLYEETPNPLHQLNAHMMPVEVTPLDDAHRRLGPGAEVEITLILDPTSTTAEIRTDLTRQQDDGNVSFVIQKPIEEIFGATASGVYEVRVDGTLVLAQVFAF